jgi:hypothetical protein
MGKLDVSVDCNKDLTVIVATGEITADDIYAAVRSCLMDEPTGKFLFDFMEADGSGISGDSFRTLHMNISKLPNASADKKIALVVSRDLGYGLSRLSATYFELTGIQGEYNIFRSMEEALGWLDI